MIATASSASVQVEPTHYDFCNYIQWERWSSYWHQIGEALYVKPRTLLYVGVGDDLVPAALSKYGVRVLRFDFDPALKPDFVGDVSHLHEIVKGEAFDVVMCCQVLEHQPFEKLQDTVTQLKTCTRKRLILSLPFFYAPIFQITLGWRRSVIVSKRFVLGKFWRKWSFDGQHYWEVGARGYSVKRVTRSIESPDFALRRFHAREFPYHLFFVLDRKG